jgi:prepilin-type processing-associated H-X9-DG protein
MGKKASQSFTIMELLVVIVTITILALIAYPTYTSVQERAKTTADLNNLRQLGLATQMYLNDNDGAIFSTSAGAGSWMSQLEPKYIPAWKAFQSPFDPRASSEAGNATTPVSYGLNGTTSTGGSSIAGYLMTKVYNPSGLIIFAPAQDSTAVVNFLGTAATAAPGVTVLRQTSNPGGTYSGTAPHGTHSNRTRINAAFGDWHIETLSWTAFIDPTATQRWDPTATPTPASTPTPTP